MHKLLNSLFSSLVLTLAGFVFAEPESANEPELPADFWIYLLEYSDTKGNIFDPNDLQLINESLKEAKKELSGTQEIETSEENVSEEEQAQ